MLGNSKKIFVFLSKKCYFSTTMNHVFTDGFGDTSVLKIKQSPLPVYLEFSLLYLLRNKENSH